jgi:hypothetical protein
MADAQADLLRASLERLRASLLAAAAARPAPLLSVPLLGAHESADVVMLAALALWGDVNTWRQHAAEPFMRAALRLPVPQDGLLDAEAVSRCVHLCVRKTPRRLTLTRPLGSALPAASATPWRRCLTTAFLRCTRGWTAWPRYQRFPMRARSTPPHLARRSWTAGIAELGEA